MWIAGDYSPTPSSLIGALAITLGISVRSLSNNKEEDLRRQYFCWWSKPLAEQYSFRRILCFEGGFGSRGSSPPKVVGAVFRCLIPILSGKGNTNGSVIMPLLASGDQVLFIICTVQFGINLNLWKIRKCRVRGCLHVKAHPGASLIPLWQCDFIPCLHETWLWRPSDAILDWMSKNGHALPVSYSQESVFMLERTAVPHLHDIGMSFHTGMKISPRYSYWGEIALVWLALVWDLALVSCKQIKSHKRELEWTCTGLKVMRVSCKHTLSENCSLLLHFVCLPEGYMSSSFHGKEFGDYYISQNTKQGSEWHSLKCQIKNFLQ